MLNSKHPEQTNLKQIFKKKGENRFHEVMQKYVITSWWNLKENP